MNIPIICTRYDIEGILSNEDFISGHPGYKQGYLYFLESKDKPGYYIISENDDEGGSVLYHVLNRTGVYDYGDGCATANTYEPVSIGIFSNNFRWQFKDYIKEHYVLDEIPLLRKFTKEEGWYKIEKLELQKWLDEFIVIKIKRQEEIMKSTLPDSEQLSFF